MLGISHQQSKERGKYVECFVSSSASAPLSEKSNSKNCDPWLCTCQYLQWLRDRSIRKISSSASNVQLSCGRHQLITMAMVASDVGTPGHAVTTYSSFTEALNVALPVCLIEPPYDVGDTSVTLPISDGTEQLVGEINGAANTAHAFVLDSCLDGAT